MANSFTLAKDSVFGDIRVKVGILDCEDGPTTGTATGLGWVVGAQATVQTAAAATNCGLVFNTAASAAGDIRCQSAASGDIFNVIVYGY